MLLFPNISNSWLQISLASFVKLTGKVCLGINLQIYVRGINIAVNSLPPRCALGSSNGKEVNRFRISEFFLHISLGSNFLCQTFFSVNFIIGHSCLYTPIYADTVLYINCCIKHAKWAKNTTWAKLSD